MEKEQLSRLMLNAAMPFDFIVLLLTTIGLLKSPCRSSLWQLLFRQGVIYFFVAFVANMTVTIFVLLNLNRAYSSFQLILMCHPTYHYQCIAMMDFMLCIPAAAASTIVACRLFISLKTFGQQDVYVHSSPSCPPTVRRSEGSGAGVDHAHVNGGGHYDSLAKRNRGTHSIAGIAFRILGEGIDSMGEVHAVDGHDTATSTNALAVLDLKPKSDSGCLNGEVVVHIETTTHTSYGMQEENYANAMDLEKGESLGHEHGQKGFVPDI